MELRSEPNPVYACIAVQDLTFACLKKKRDTNRYKRADDLLVCNGKSQTLSATVYVADCADSDSKGSPLQIPVEGNSRFHRWVLTATVDFMLHHRLIKRGGC